MNLKFWKKQPKISTPAELRIVMEGWQSVLMATGNRLPEYMEGEELEMHQQLITDALNALELLLDSAEAICKDPELMEYANKTINKAKKYNDILSREMMK